MSAPDRRGLWTLAALMESSSLSLQSFPHHLGKRRAFSTATHRPYYYYMNLTQEGLYAIVKRSA